ncbi:MULTISPECIES: nuclear transport factor 2 family protein [Saccharothrix]|uniref:nuclear transport factor 2 family protein n=1 Tax=Saccharothrix TaxID=2071 RepID=UPI0009FA6C09|nr:nuclear transport factor 2 family protein [Saccharothrix sp. CB00851]
MARVRAGGGRSGSPQEVVQAGPGGPHLDQFDLWFRSTVCLRRVDGVWRIAHEHTSTPFYMDGSFSAALDLTP